MRVIKISMPTRGEGMYTLSHTCRVSCREDVRSTTVVWIDGMGKDGKSGPTRGKRWHYHASGGTDASSRHVPELTAVGWLPARTGGGRGVLSGSQCESMDTMICQRGGWAGAPM